MLKKVLFALGLVGVAFLTGYATAQSYFTNQFSGKTEDASQQSQNAPAATDFQSQTQQQQDKKNQALNQQLSQELAKIPPPPPPPAPHEASKTPTDQGPIQESSPSSAAEPKSPTAATTPTPPVTPSGPTPAAPPVSAPSQTQVYTGFQNQDDKTPPAPGQQNSSGGWNIQY